MLIKSAWQVIILGVRVVDVVPFHLCFNPPSLFSGNYLTPLTFCVSLLRLMASLCSSQSLLFFFFNNGRRRAMCLYTTLSLPGIKCCLLIKMSPWQMICRKEGFFFVLCLVSETGWLSLISERYLIILLERPQWGQRSVRGGQWHSCGSRVEPVMDDMPEWATLPSQAPVLTGLALASHIQHQ